MSNPKIQVLPDHVANQIAAGEVVERPVSVVRELVDNAIDAGASEISVFLEDGGRALIRVSDNGHGMDRQSATLAFERHATSKLSTLDDLLSIATLGFRGEALPSIASVSRVLLRTKAANDDSGTEIQIEGGVLQNVKACAGSRGSDISIKHLFFNTPARKKFLKEAKSEEVKIKQWLLSSSVSHPKIHYRLFSDGKEILSLPSRGSAVARARDLVRGSTVEVGSGLHGIRVEGLLGHPGSAKADISTLVLFVNGRMVSDRMLARAVKDGFSSTLKDREFPLGFVHIEINPGAVDVNVHPQKSEVRFRCSQEVFAAVRRAVSEAVKDFKIPVSTGSTWSPLAGVSSRDQQSGFTFSRQVEVRNFEYPQSAPGEDVTVREESPSYIAAAPTETFTFSSLRYLGQVMRCYLLCERDEQLVVVDMHAAHERYNYNIIKNSLTVKRLHSQQLAVPFVIELNEEDKLRALSHRELLAGLGFDIDDFGPTNLVVRSHPVLVKTAKIADFINDVSRAQLPDEASGRWDEAVSHIAARLACHASVRSGDELSRDEVYALFEALDSSEFSAACPHGRPVVVAFSETEIERWFGRDK